MDLEQRGSFITLFQRYQTEIGRAVRAVTECDRQRGSRDSWWLGAALALASVLSLSPGAVLAQSEGFSNANSISVQFGQVTQHYLTTWSDPTLPAGVWRGLPPNQIEENTADDASPTTNASEQDMTPSSSEENPEEPADEAVLYAVDLGEGGMTMIVSAKRVFRPGDCVAVERSGNYLNLRSVNLGFCDPTNQASIDHLQSVNVATAQRCKVAREQRETMALEENQALTPSEVGMLCDGS